jgi:phosphoserine phosphatase RsbU/P
LIHEDKDGHQLCGEEFCPLHRAIVTDTASPEAVLVYAQTKSGKRVPVEVSVSPIHDADGKVTGGIEVFRDLRAAEEDLRCAQLIQQQTLATVLPEDSRYQFGIRYVPRDLVGGDFYRVEAVAPSGYAGMVADVMGHGVSAALYTMQLRALWEEFRSDLPRPALFFERLNAGLHLLAHDNDYFATGFYFFLDAANGQLSYVNAGHPAPILLRNTGEVIFLSEHGPGLGLFDSTTYPESMATLEVGDALVAYTDGAAEIFNAAGEEMQESGLAAVLKQSGIGSEIFEFDRLEEDLLKFNSRIRFPDDLTLLRVRRSR